MINLADALKIIHEVSDYSLESENVLLGDAINRVLAEDVLSDIDIPAFDKSAMDGYACRREDLGLILDIQEMIQAGHEPNKHIEKGQCSQIMTGAKIPVGADCVVMQEFVEEVKTGKIIFTGQNTANNILYQAEDLNSGEQLLSKGTKISAQNLAIIAAAGLSEVSVFKKKNIAVICTGSELVEANKPLIGAKIRNTNKHQLSAQVASCGHIPVYFGIVPDDAQIKDTIINAMKHCEVIILTGGASVGKFDLVPKILDELGFDLKFQKIAIQPGKPVSFSVKRKHYCFGLSGNPVSSFLQFELLARPLLAKLAGEESQSLKLKLKFKGSFSRNKAERRFFLPVVINEKGQATNPEYHGSAHLHALNGIFGFAEIPEGQYKLNKGDSVYVRPI